MRTDRNGRQHNTMPPTVNNEYKPPSRDAKWNKVLWALFIVLFLGCAALGAQILGVVDFKAMLGLKKASHETPSVQAPQDPGNSEGGEAVADGAQGASGASGAESEAPSAAQRAQVDKIVKDARVAIENKRLASARSKLETAKVLDPDRFEIYDLLAQVYEQTGEQEKAKAVRSEVQTLRAQATSEDTLP